jgi:hypothetical protein
MVMGDAAAAVGTASTARRKNELRIGRILNPEFFRFTDFQHYNVGLDIKDSMEE